MTTDTGLPGEAAEPIEPVTETLQAPVFGEALSAIAPAALHLATIDPAAIEAEAEQHAQAAARRVRRRRNALRWAGAVVLMLAVGGGTAYALTIPQRTDMPGLGTVPDGRYTFPALTLPALPAGQPAPSASENSEAKQHLADIRKLLLPQPVGATAQSVKGAVGGWLADPSALFVDRDSKRTFAEFGLRHTAASSWKTSDGATTTIYLLQFADAKLATSAQTALSDGKMTAEDENALTTALTGGPTDTSAQDLVLLASGLPGEYSTLKASGTLTRYGSFLAGDISVLIVQSGPASLPFAPFQQVMSLQAEMLQ